MPSGLYSPILSTECKLYEVVNVLILMRGNFSSFETQSIRSTPKILKLMSVYSSSFKIILHSCRERGYGYSWWALYPKHYLNMTNMRDLVEVFDPEEKKRTKPQRKQVKSKKKKQVTKEDRSCVCCLEEKENKRPITSKKSFCWKLSTNEM